MEEKKQEEFNLTGSLDLMRLEGVGFKTIQGKTCAKRCLVIPVEDNEIFVTRDENLCAKAAYYAMGVYQRQSVSEHGATHYAKPVVSKKFAEAFPELAEKRRKTYIGDFKPYVFEGGDAANKVQADVVTPAEDDDLPF